MIAYARVRLVPRARDELRSGWDEMDHGFMDGNGGAALLACCVA